MWRTLTEKDEAGLADLPGSLHHGLRMETDLYIVEGHIHKFGVYYCHSADFSAQPRTLCKYMTSSFAVVWRFFDSTTLLSFIVQISTLLCKYLLYYYWALHPMLDPAFPSQLKGSKRQNSSLSFLLLCPRLSLSFIPSYSFQLLSPPPSSSSFSPISFFLMQI